TKWDALLPTDASLSMCAAIDTLAAQYRQDNPQLSVGQSRADALVDLVLADVQVSTTATLIIPTTSAPGSEPAPATDPGQDDPSRHDGSGTTTPRQTDAPTGPAGGGPSGTASHPQPEPADHRSGRPQRLTQPPCDCAGRSRSWIDLLAALDRPGVLLAGPWAGDLPDPPVQGRYATAVQQAIDADANPHLARDWHGRVWFVPKPVTVPPVGLLLPAQVSALLADPDTIIRLGVANPHTGAVDILDEQTYRPGAKLDRLVRARDGTCRYPGCATPAQRCDLDHVIAYPAGPTSAANLQTLCRTHHGFKHHGGWTVTMTPDGICTWTAPNGRSHTTHPHNLHDDAA
ncbi:MAG: HNH endonuclease signature motif containing protein, partial [Dermatophilaceae bacterium]